MNHVCLGLHAAVTSPMNRLCFGLLHAAVTSPVSRSSFGRITARSVCSQYGVIESGSLNTIDYKIYFRDTKSSTIISPFHDIPLWPNRQVKTTVHMVVEMPRWTNLKMEISKEDRFNPVKQISKEGKLGFAANFFPYHGYIWNYGSLPQTWGNPKVVDECTGGEGDNDPIDVLEIGYKVANRGDVLQVNILGVLAVINDGKVDWKIITIDSKDPLASQIKELDDVDTYYPGLLEATAEWFRVYKVPNGGIENEIAYKGRAKGQVCAVKVIEELYTFWCCLLMNISDKGVIHCDNTSIKESPYNIGVKTAREFFKSIPKREEPKALNPVSFADVQKKQQKIRSNLESSKFLSSNSIGRKS